jgi:hypothetical protein
MADGGKVQVSGGGGSMHGPVKGYGAGLNLEATKDLGKGASVTAGVSASSYDAKGQGFRERDTKIDGAQLRFNKRF